MSLADTASALLAKNGEPVVVSYALATPAYDPITGEPQAPSASVTATANGYPSAYKSKDIDGDTIRANDVRLILELLDQRPAKGDHALVDGVKYRIMNVLTIRKAGSDILYICQLRAN